MLEISVSQAQKQFSKIISHPTMIVNKKNSLKKAVILPYDIYQELLNQSMSKTALITGGFADFVGVLDNGFKTDDKKYQKITQ